MKWKSFTRVITKSQLFIYFFNGFMYNKKVGRKTFKRNIHNYVFCRENKKTISMFRWTKCIAFVLPRMLEILLDTIVYNIDN